MVRVNVPAVWICAISILLSGCYQVYADDVVALNDGNVDSILKQYDIVLVNFYADWCRFSQILKPTFEEAGKKVRDDPKTQTQVMFAKVDCDRETNIASRYRINKYPTLKLFRNGEAVKKEYRGQRSVEALFQFAEEQAKNPIEEVENLAALESLEAKKSHIIAYFDSKDSEHYRVLSKVANTLRDDCLFHVAVGEVSQNERIAGDRVMFRAPNTQNEDLLYSGDLNSFEMLHAWTVDKCLPLVREITFENAEELTEEGLPFLILFHDSDDKEIVEMFNTEVARQLLGDKASVNFLIADGHKFAHPLHHLGKAIKDLPVLAIDSFRHMYLFPHDVRKNLASPGLLKKFVDDLHSGKLHREFHHGPDPTESPPEPPKIDDNSANNIPRTDGPQPPAAQKITSPPESTFKKLAPSRNRYTILKDEL